MNRTPYRAPATRLVIGPPWPTLGSFAAAEIERAATRELARVVARFIRSPAAALVAWLLELDG